MSKGAMAIEIHKGGLNCAQALVAAFCSDEHERQSAVAAAGCFGGGMRRGATCGAATGALMALGRLVPFTNGADAEKKAYIGELARKFNNRFLAEMESLDCKDILKSGPKEIVCPHAIDIACTIVEELIAQQE